MPTGLVNLGAFLLDDQFNVELQHQAAESTGEGKVISSPRVVTLDNREAEIEQGVSIPFQTFENGDAQLEFIDAVLSLERDAAHHGGPQHHHEARGDRATRRTTASQTPTGSPAIAKNQAKTETLVRDGQTLVIGGIYTIQKADRAARGVPYLWKIPILGCAFRNNEIRDIRKELLIFVTPRIVVNPQAEPAGRRPTRAAGSGPRLRGRRGELRLAPRSPVRGRASRAPGIFARSAARSGSWA